MTEKEMIARIESLQNRISAAETDAKEYREAIKYMAYCAREVTKYNKLMMEHGTWIPKEQHPDEHLKNDEKEV